MNRSRPALLAAVAASVVLAGCGSEKDAPSSSSPSASTAVSIPSTSEASVTATSISVAPSTAGFEASITQLTGGAHNGSTWDFTVPQVTGGSTRTRQAFNGAVDRAADRIVSGVRDDQKTTVTNGELTPPEGSRTVVARTTLSGVLITLGAAEGAAYPSRDVETVVLDPGSNQTLALDAVFADPAAARQRLVALVKSADTSGRLAQTEITGDSLNLWIALDEGLHLYVPVIHALGDYVPVTIPWPALSGLLSPTGQVLFSST